MLTRILTGIVVAIAFAAIGRGIVSAFALDAWVARMIRGALDSQYLSAIAWTLSGVVGLAALTVWIGLRLDEKVYNLWSPRPALGSLYRNGEALLVVTHSQADNRTVPLQNGNDTLLAFRCELRATVNGKDLDAPVSFDGYVNANTATSLILDMPDIPLQVQNNTARVQARLRYSVVYFFPNNKGRTRRTSKLVEWNELLHLTGVPGTRQETRMQVRYYDEVEE
jgi:hypothetical protein